MNYPASLDNGTSLPNPSGTNTQNNPDHAGLHTSENQAIIALEGKVGTGATTPTANTILFGTGAGTTAWQGLTSAQLAATLSDETGTGSAVFANTPVLITPKVDTINENTSGNGVTVGGVNLKSGVVGANGVVTASITDANVTNSKLQNTGSFNSSWAWQSWTPTLTNMTLGNGTVAASYAQIGKTIHLRFSFTLGSTSSVGSSPNFSVPATAKTANNERAEFVATFEQTGLAIFYGYGFLNTTTTVGVYAGGAGGSYVNAVGVTSTVPFTWANTHILFVAGTYEAA